MTRKRMFFCIALVSIMALFIISGCRSQPDVKTPIEIAEQEAAERAKIEAEKRIKAEEAVRRKKAEVQRQKQIEEQRRRIAREEAAQRATERREQEDREARERFVETNIYFDYNESTLRWDSQEELKIKAEWMRAHPDIEIIIEGHCDERGSAPYNIALGERRAETAKNFIVDLGVEAERIETVSFGEERPVDPRSSEEAWSKNRRAHFVIK
ncbi:peptidoglycan-associated lipoprotein [Candidatus Magnetomorum sp. HK-1]|nr:peptidoglycan-associated lipoprotein [Candidatus Magnetomorum sp. HK-1]